jgi:exodeoxyribonuclease-1
MSKPIESIVVYDTETTGVNTRFDEITQFAAKQLDHNLDEIAAVEYLARPDQYTIASPKALLVQGRGIEEINAHPLSQYQLAEQIAGFVDGRRPALFLGYNSVMFDDEVARHTMYRQLPAPYLFQTGGNTRADVLRFLWLARRIEPESFVVPKDERGRRSYKLGPTALANGYDAFAEHNALGDVGATVHLLRLIAKRVPPAWWLVRALAQRAAVDEALEESLFLWKIDDRAAALRAIVPLGPNPARTTEYFALDLGTDPSSLFGLSSDKLVAVLKPPLLQTLRLNQLPLIVPPDCEPGRHLLKTAEVSTEALKWAKSVRSDRDFCQRAVAAALLQRRQYPAPVCVKQRLYERFFPLREDEVPIAMFHTAAPATKRALLPSMRDERARELGMRILFNEWPEVLLPEEYADLAETFRERMLTLIPRALAEIAELRQTAPPIDEKMLEEYEQYLWSGMPPSRWP